MHARLRTALLVVLSAVLPAMPAGAQQSAAPAQAGPRIEATAAAFRVPADADERTALMQARTNSMGRPIALIYGLYLYLR